MKINLIEYFEETVQKKPDNIAVSFKDKDFSFFEIKRRSNIISAVLDDVLQGMVTKPVAVFLPKSIDAVIANLACMYTGNPFMNLDVKTPLQRLEGLFSLVKPAAVITTKKLSVGLSSVTIGIPVFLIDDIDFNTAPCKTGSQNWRKLISTDPFCLINTSGSTGVPKSVVLSYGSFFDYLESTNDIFNFDGSEIIGSLSPIVFDHYIYEFCMMMRYGSQLVLLEEAHSAFPAKLLDTLVNRRVNYIFWVPSIMVTIANMDLLSKIKLADLKLVWFAGEVFPTKQFLYWYDKLPQARFVNLYGPVEITLDCTLYTVEKRPPEDEPLPIGKPLKNTDVLLLNDDNKSCAVMEEGEICVRGVSLAKGYYNNPEKTAAAFTQNPLNTAYPEIIYRTGDVGYMRQDGNIMFKGRKDSLIKHMGIRIELSEIEHALQNTLKLTKYCCAVYNESKKEITLFYENDGEISPKEFRSALTTMLPAYMVPSVFIKLDSLPRNTNGKIDRFALKNKANED